MFVNFSLADGEPTSTAVLALYGIAKQIDEGVTVDAVVKNASAATMVRLSPSEGGGTRFLALQTALKLSYPFDTVTVVENVSTGAVQLQVLLHPFTEQMKQARNTVKSFTSMKILTFVSKLVFACAVSSFGLLLQGEILMDIGARVN